MQPKHRDATRVARKLRGRQRGDRGALDAVEGYAVKAFLYVCDEKTHPDKMVLTALTQFSCKVGHLIIVAHIREPKLQISSFITRLFPRIFGFFVFA